MRLHLLVLMSVLGGQAFGQAVCGNCHRDIAETWAKTGMANSFAPVTAAEEFRGLRYRHEASGDEFSFSTLNGLPALKREQTVFGGATGNVLEKAIAFRFGSGEHSRSYFGRDAGGNLVELPVSWYSEAGGIWRMSPGYDVAQHAGFSRKVNPQCLFCHSAYPEAGATQVQAVGIDCQRCHGNGAAHVANPTRATIVNPARLGAARRVEVCLQCHLETTNLPLPGEIIRYDRNVFSYQPGEPLSDYALYFDHKQGAGYDEKFEFSSAPYRLFKSACYRANPAALTCTTCHDPHGGDRSAAHYATVCKSCHPAERLARLKHPPGQDCVSCHMAQRRPTDAIHVTVTDHLISRSPQNSLPQVAVERNGNNAPPYRGEVVPYYPRDGAGVRDFELYRALAQVRDQANLAAGIPELTAAVDSHKATYAGACLALADALRLTGEMGKAAARYRQAIESAPNEWRAHYGLALALRGYDATNALRSLERALTLAPGEYLVYDAASGIRAGMGQNAEAMAILRKGLNLLPDSAELRNNLGAALLRAGSLKEAEAEFREAVRLRPELGAMRMNLASLLARTNRTEEANFEFEAAVRLAPDSAEIRSGYGAALAAQTRWGDARRELEAAIRLNPRLANTHNNLGTVLRQLGDEGGARSEFATALQLDPGLEAAKQNLNSLRR